MQRVVRVLTVEKIEPDTTGLSLSGIWGPVPLTFSLC